MGGLRLGARGSEFGEQDIEGFGDRVSKAKDFGAYYCRSHGSRFRS
jgi:hypothetical protein